MSQEIEDILTEDEIKEMLGKSAVQRIKRTTGK